MAKEFPGPDGPGAGCGDPAGFCGDSAVLDAFLKTVEEAGLSLYPAQEEAVLALFEGFNVILNTPTGSGKSLVARALHFRSVAGSGRSVYTSPIKALVNEKWAELCAQFGPESVGLSTGDASVNPGAPILCCTAEVLANIALRQGVHSEFSDVVMDEFHYYSDPERGVAWQVPLLTLPRSRFLLMSATLGDTVFFEQALTDLNGRQTVRISSDQRPVPLEFEYSEKPLADTIGELLQTRKSPVYVVHFTQADAAATAQELSVVAACPREKRAEISAFLEGIRFNSPYGPELKRMLRMGIGLHHAGLLPRYKLAVEHLAQRGLLQIVCGTDTLGVGINVPIKTVLFTRLCKFTGKKNAILSVRDFLQISGRAGRKGFDERGWVVVQAPEHHIENLQLEKKQRDGGRKFVKRKPPEHNFTNWDKKTFERLVSGEPERLVSRFRLTAGMILNVLARGPQGASDLRALLRRSHEGPRGRTALRRRGWQLFRGLLAQGIVQRVSCSATQSSSQTVREECDAPRPAPDAGALSVHFRVDPGLQGDFSLHHALSLFVVDTLPFLEPNHPDYAWRVLSLVEATLEDPQPVLRRQLDKAKGEAIARMKSEGIPYEERMEELEKIEHPQPEREFLETCFSQFAERNPWVGGEQIYPKSVARELLERSFSFEDYVKFHGLERMEGMVLRYFSGVYKALAQTVPDSAKDPLLWEMEFYLAALLRQVDSSVLEQWERMRSGGSVEVPGGRSFAVHGFVSHREEDVTRDERAFVERARAGIFAALRALAQRQWAMAWEAACGVAPDAAQEESLRISTEAYFEARGRFRLDAEGRNRRHTYSVRESDTEQWRIQQMLVDPEGLNDWIFECEVDWPASRAAKHPILRSIRVAPFCGETPDQPIRG